MSVRVTARCRQLGYGWMPESLGSISAAVTRLRGRHLPDAGPRKRYELDGDSEAERDGIDE